MQSFAYMYIYKFIFIIAKPSLEWDSHPQKNAKPRRQQIFEIWWGAAVIVNLCRQIQGHVNSKS